jgi:hypothetical protein
MNKRHVFVRPISPHESALFLGWALENPHGEFDAEVPRFPSSRTWCAYDKDGPLVFQTIQQPLMLESLAPRPGATKEQIAIATKELTQNAITQASLGGSGEIYYLSSDPDTDRLATNQIFTELPYKVFRVKLADLVSSK